MRVLAIDPGTTQSAWLIYDTSGEICERGFQFNEEIRALLIARNLAADHLAIEYMISSFGMSVGKETFTTVFWTGRLVEAWLRGWRIAAADRSFTLVTRDEVKRHVCQSPRANDANVRAALLDRFGPPGTKKMPGATYGISKHLWAALAVAVTYAERPPPAPPPVAKAPPRGLPAHLQRDE